MTGLLAAVFVASLAGSLHCAGMCGGFVAFYSGADRSEGRSRLAAHIAYNGGRLLAYVALGIVFGALGAAVDLAGSMAGVQRSAKFVAGGLMVLWGTYAMLQALNVRVPRPPLPGFVARLTARAHRTLRDRPPVARAAILGLLSALLPCGWLYAFAVLAAGVGSPWAGAAVMAAFWLGTVPVMFGLGVSVQALAAPLRRRIPAISAAALIALGLLWLAGRMGAPPVASRNPEGLTPTLEQAAEQAGSLSPEKVPCCDVDP